MAQRSLSSRVWYDSWRVVCRLAGVLVFHVRCRGRDFVPKSGGALVLSNHQSHLDPILIGLACDRRLNYLARQTLFAFAPLAWVMSTFDTIPLDREGLGLSGLKETLRRLKRGEMVLIFPEGTRTHDGDVGILKPGFCALAKRANVPLLPAAMDGAFESWPRSHRLPGPATIHIHFGPPIMPAEIGQFASDEALVAEIERRITACHEAARAAKQRAQSRG